MKGRSGKLIGRIIFANLLELSLFKYFTFIKELENQGIINKWLRNGLIKKQNLSQLPSLLKVPNKKYSIIGECKKLAFEDAEYEIEYVHPCFQTYYEINDNLMLSNTTIAVEKQLLHKLVRVNSRNFLTHKILSSLLRLQSEFLASGNFLSLKIITQAALTKIINSNTMSLNTSSHSYYRIDQSWISRVSSNLNITLPDKSIQQIDILLPSSRDRIKYALRKLLKEETQKLIGGNIYGPYTDDKLLELLNNRFDITTTKRNVREIRHILGIPSAVSRSRDYAYQLTTQFSNIYSLNAKIIDNHVPNCSGVYEFRCDKRKISYPNGDSPIFYIGRAKILRKRLKEQLRVQHENRTGIDSLKEEPCNFRFQVVDALCAEEERRLYDLFVTAFGAPPKGNQIRPGLPRER